MLRETQTQTDAHSSVPPHALVADDDVELALSVAEVLRTAGCNVHCVADGARALEQALCSEPDIVLLDHRMPHLTGGEVLEALGRIGFPAPVVMMTSAEYVEGLRTLGAGNFLVKPFDAEDLLRTLWQALKQEGTR